MRQLICNFCIVFVILFSYGTGFAGAVYIPTLEKTVPKLTTPAGTTAEPCMAGGSVAVNFGALPISRYLVWFAAILLFAGVFQILLALFIFLSDALDIYMLLINYCIATLFCITVILVSGMLHTNIDKRFCEIASPMNCVAISVPMFTLFLLSYSRYYAISFPFRYISTFSIKNQIMACSLSWLIPVTVSVLGTLFLCKSQFIFLRQNPTGGTCIYPVTTIKLKSYIFYNDTAYEEFAKSNGSVKVDSISEGSGYPADVQCQVFLYLYVSICLILPLLGCIVCYSSIVYQLTIIAANRKEITSNSQSVSINTEKLVTVNLEPEQKPAPKTLKKKLSNKISFTEIRKHFQTQTAKISNQAKGKVPVSVILILTMYILVAVPLTVVEVFNTSFTSASINEMGFINTPNAIRQDLIYQSKRLCFNIASEDSSTEKLTPMAFLLDCMYSIGLTFLGLSPWAYIKFTKSFEDNLWKKPFKRLTSKVGLQIRKSTKRKMLNEVNKNSRGKRVTSTSGYSGYSYSTGPSQLIAIPASPLLSATNNNIPLPGYPQLRAPNNPMGKTCTSPKSLSKRTAPLSPLNMRANPTNLIVMKPAKSQHPVAGREALALSPTTSLMKTPSPDPNFKQTKISTPQSSTPHTGDNPARRPRPARRVRGRLSDGDAPSLSADTTQTNTSTTDNKF